MDSLPPELLENIFLHLDLLSALALSSCSIYHQRILAQPVIFGKMLKRLKFETAKSNNRREQDLEDRMKTNCEVLDSVTKFLSLSPSVESLTPLLQSSVLHQFGCSQWFRLVQFANLDRFCRKKVQTEGTFFWL